MIEKALVLSTSHIPDDSEVYTSCDLLFEDDHPRCESHVYGWIVFLMSGDDYGCPDWFEPIRQLAVSEDAAFVVFDQDADTVDNITTYDW